MIKRFNEWLLAKTSREAPDSPKEPESRRVAFSDWGKNILTGNPDVVASPWFQPPAPHWVQRDVAMDSAAQDAFDWASQSTVSEGLTFLGFGRLSEMSQRPEYRKASEELAKECTRKFIKLAGDKDRVVALEQALIDFDVAGKFREAIEHDGFFGRAHVFIDLGHELNDSELGFKLQMRSEKVVTGSLKGLKVIEPYWVYPMQYETTDPTSPFFYRPQVWQVMGGQVHTSRLLTMTSREVPDILKPAYSFAGLSMSQMIKPYVDNWIRTRQSISDLIQTFSHIVLATDLATYAQNPSEFNSRLDILTRLRNNRGTIAIDKESEALTNVAVPLGTLDKLQAQAQEQICSAAGQPLVVFTGITPSGLNASSEGELKVWYANIKSHQERVVRAPLQTILEVMQLHLFGDIDAGVSFEFLDLWEMDEEAKARIRKSDADADIGYEAAGVVSNEEIRTRIVTDENSPYFSADLSAPAPDMPSDPSAILGSLSDGQE
jgi:uncharacterized protein